MSDITRHKIEQALLYIEQHLDKKLSAEQIAQAACLSSFHFQRMFSLYLGESVAQYVLHRRLERAAQLLLTTPNATLLDLALATGFETHSAFSRVFRQHFGISPSVFRNNPNAAQISQQPSRPFLKPLPATSQIDFKVVELADLHFNYKADQGRIDGTFLTQSQPQLLIDFAYLGKQANLFGLCSAFPASPQNLNEQSAKVYYGGIFSHPPQPSQMSAWSPNWLTLKAGLWAIFSHRGSYEYLYQTWNQGICCILNNADYHLRDELPFEMYLTSPQALPINDWLTHIYIPIKTADPEQHIN